MIDRLIFIGIELAVLGIAAAMFYIGGYLVAPEKKRLSRAKGMKWFGAVFWLWLPSLLVTCFSWLLDLRG